MILLFTVCSEYRYVSIQLIPNPTPDRVVDYKSTINQPMQLAELSIRRLAKARQRFKPSWDRSHQFLIHRSSLSAPQLPELFRQ